jgi:hypothetical protein
VLSEGSTIHGLVWFGWSLDAELNLVPANSCLPEVFVFGNKIVNGLNRISQDAPPK